MKIFGRRRWTTSSPGGERQEVGKDSTLFVHHSAGSGMNVNRFREQVNVLISIRHYHVGTNGWEDIGYNYVVFQPYGKLRRARVFECRGRHHVPAAQQDHNTGNLAVCVIANNEPIKDSTVRAIAKLYRTLPCSHVKGHRDVNNTDCPGDKLYGKLDEIRRAK